MSSLSVSIYTKLISNINTSNRITSNLALRGPVAAAVLSDPKKFSEAAETFVKALGSAIDLVPKAVEALKSARSLITSTTTDKALIVNLSKKEITWYTYNDVAPIKWKTQFQSFMGEYTTVVVHTLGFGSMHTFKENQNPPYTVERGKIYAFDGKNLSLFLEKPVNAAVNPKN